MAEIKSKPTVVFTHGSWHQASHFEPVSKVFEAAGYPTSVPQLPSFGAAPEIGLMEDAQRVRDELSRLIEKEGKDVILVGHSYGGVVITQGADESFAKKTREAEGKPGGILRLLYMCAFMLPPNLSLAGAFGGSLPPYIDVDDQGMCYMTEPAERFYHDLSPSDQEHWVGQLARCPSVTQFTAITNVAYAHHPVTYLFCRGDRALPFQVQQMMVENAEKNAGVTIAREYCDASHSPFLSVPERVLEVVGNMGL